MQKQMAKAIPTWARALDRFAAVVTSERMALWNLHGRVVSHESVYIGRMRALHGELDVAFAQTSDDPGEKVG